MVLQQKANQDRRGRALCGRGQAFEIGAERELTVCGCEK